MIELQHLDGIIAAITAAVVAIAWLVRLEYLGKTNTRDIETLNLRVITLEAKHDALDSKVVDQLTEIKISLAKIEGKLGIET